jgi:hypothetical protein
MDSNSNLFEEICSQLEKLTIDDSMINLTESEEIISSQININSYEDVIQIFEGKLVDPTNYEKNILTAVAISRHLCKFNF